MFEETPTSVDIINIQTDETDGGYGRNFILAAKAYCDEHGKQLIGSSITNWGFVSAMAQMARSMGMPVRFEDRGGQRVLVYDPQSRTTAARACPTCGDPYSGQYGTFCPRCQWSENDANLDADPLSNPPDPTQDMHRSIQASRLIPSHRWGGGWFQAVEAL